MRATLKTFAAILVCAFLLPACKGAKEEDHSREDFLTSESLGIYKDGSQILTFIKSKHQYHCILTEGIYRITDNEGTHDATIKLSGLSAVGGEMSGTVSGNMGITGFSFSGLKILKTDNRTAWLWSDKDKVGFIIPSAGLTSVNTQK